MGRCSLQEGNEGVGTEVCEDQAVAGTEDDFQEGANSLDGGQLMTFPFSVERAKASGWAVFGISGSGKSNAGFSLVPLFPYLPPHRLLVFAGTNSLLQTVQNH